MPERKSHVSDEGDEKGVAGEIRYVAADEESQPTIGKE
jgi:hypothetical protein